MHFRAENPFCSHNLLKIKTLKKCFFYQKKCRTFAENFKTYIIMKKIIFCLALTTLFLTTACNKKAQQNSDTVAIEPTSDFINVDFENFVFDENVEESRVKVHVYADIPKADNDALKKIRNSVIDFIYKKGDTPKEAFNNYAKSCVAYFAITPDDFSDDFSDDPMMHSEIFDSITPTIVNQYFIQYCNNNYTYGAGAAHEMYGIGYYIFDLETGNRLEEKDVFTNTKKIENLLKTEGYQNYLKDAGLSESETDIQKSSIVVNENFGVTSTDLLYQYNPYEITCYAEGAPLFRISKESVKPYLKKGTAIYKYWFGEE